jgi:hypothetical protein
VDPVGTANEGVYERVREAFESSVDLEAHLGGEPVEDVAVYFSSDSKMSFAENGSWVADERVGWGSYPHLQAVRGASRILQRSHLPFGIVTRRQLDDLDRYGVIVLPNVARMDRLEVAAIRHYVERGGRLYASGYTSLVETRGVLHDDFMLADIFGVHLDSEEPGRVVYARPTTRRVQALLEPQRYLTADPLPGALAGGILNVRADRGSRILAMLSLPYRHPEMGHVSERNWASIHSSPPWEDTNTPVLVERRHGAGRVVYSTLDIERENADANDRLFAGLIWDLLGRNWSLRCETHPAVWVSAFRKPEDRTVRISLLNSPPALVPKATIRLRPPEGARFVRLEEIPSGRPIRYRTGSDGTIGCTIRRPSELTMLVASYANA